MNFSDQFSKPSEVINFLSIDKKTITKNQNINNDIGLFDDFDAIYVYVENPELDDKGQKVFTKTTYTIIGSFGEMSYLKWGNIKQEFNQYLKNNINKIDNLKIDVRLRAPKTIYDNDLNYNKLNEYSFFDINFKSDILINYVSTSSVEKKMPVAFVEPSMIWDKMVGDYVSEWKKSIKK
jgi:hypothetical protein